MNEAQKLGVNEARKLGAATAIAEMMIENFDAVWELITEHEQEFLSCDLAKKSRDRLAKRLEEMK